MQASFSERDHQVIFTTTEASSGGQKDALLAAARSSVLDEFTCCHGRPHATKTTRCLSGRIKQHAQNDILTSASSHVSRVDSAVNRHLAESKKCINGSLPQQVSSSRLAAQPKTFWTSWKYYTSTQDHHSCAAKKKTYAACCLSDNIYNINSTTNTKICE